MPEGPSIIILKEQAQIFAGRKVIAVSGNTKEEKERALHHKVIAFKSWGKHFLICFKGFTIRIHFMLWGSYRINETKDTTPRLSLKFRNGELHFYACSVKILQEDLNELYDWSADVMSGSWDPKAAKKKLKAHPRMLVCDALLDQHIFSGVGNIIKNEVLFRIRLHPETQTGAVPARKLSEMVKEAVNYSFDFLEWKKQYVLKKNWLVHTRKICPRCQIPLRKSYPGKTRRRTFYCDNCQVYYPPASSRSFSAEHSE